LSQKSKSGKILKLKATAINPKSKVIKKASKLGDESEPKCEQSNSQSGNTTNIINNITNNNNNYNENYNVTTCKV
jgi:hypothetical protein